MSTTGLVLKPLTPAEASKSRSLSGAARSAASSAAINPTSVVDRPQVSEGSFVSTYMRQQEAKDKKPASANGRTENSGQKSNAKGKATPGSGMLSSDVLFVLQANSGQGGNISSASSDGGQISGAQGGQVSLFSPKAPQALSAYSRAQESVDRTRTATATRFALEEANAKQAEARAKDAQTFKQSSDLDTEAEERQLQEERSFTERVTALPSELQADLEGAVADVLAGDGVSNGAQFQPA